MSTLGMISTNLSLHPLLHTHLPTLTNTHVQYALPSPQNQHTWKVQNIRSVSILL